VFNYQGDDLPRALQVSESLQVRVADSGQEVFVAVANGNGTFATSEGAANVGGAVIDAGSVVDPSAWTGHDYRITFVTNGAGQLGYNVVDTTSGTQVVPTPPANPVADAPALPAGGGTIAFAGVQVTVQGAPAVGDTFTVVPSTERDLLTTVQALVDVLERGASGVACRAHFQNALGRVITDLDRGLDNVLRVRGSLGARLNAVESQRQIAEDFELFARQSLSAVEDLDYAEAVSRLQLELTVLQASQQAYLKVQGLSLFNYL
jgi:flagellar hook-associated protein 3 FlgL